MTSKLYEMLVKEYLLETKDSRREISIYGADERIYLSLFHRIFIGKDKLITPEEINRIARGFFGLFYKMKEIDKNQTIIFNSDSDMEYEEYHGHLIIVHGHFLFPEMEIWTGNRGNCILTEEQRQKYFGFVKEVYNQFIENAKI